MLYTHVVMKLVTIRSPVVKKKLITWAQLFEGRLALILTRGKILPGFLFLVFKSIFSDNFLCYF